MAFFYVWTHIDKAEAFSELDGPKMMGLCLMNLAQLYTKWPDLENGLISSGPGPFIANFFYKKGMLILSIKIEVLMISPMSLHKIRRILMLSICNAIHNHGKIIYGESNVHPEMQLNNHTQVACKGKLLLPLFLFFKQKQKCMQKFPYYFVT